AAGGSSLGGARRRAAARRMGREFAVSRDAEVRESGDGRVERVSDPRWRCSAAALGDGAGAEIGCEFLAAAAPKGATLRLRLRLYGFQMSFCCPEPDCSASRIDGPYCSRRNG